jgi:hypothetical protein
VKNKGHDEKALPSDANDASEPIESLHVGEYE